MNFRLFSKKRGYLPKWADTCVVIVAGLLYSIVAGLFLERESSYFDEGFTSYLARFSPLDIAHYTALDVHPPLYYIVLHYWQQLFGIDVVSLRFMSILWGVIALVFVFLLVRKMFGSRAGYSALVFVILSPLFIRYSEAMRMYTMAIALVTAGTYALILLATNATSHRRRTWGIYALLVSAGMWTNYFTAFVWLAHFAWIVWEKRIKKDQFLRDWLIAIGAAVVLYLPWLPWLLVRFASVQATGFWIPPISVDTIVSTITTATTYTNSSQTTNWLAVGVCLYVILATFVIIRVYKSLAANKNQQAIFRLLIMCAAVPIIGLIIVSLPPFRSSFVYRYVLNGVFMSTIVIGCSFALVTFKRNSLFKKVGLYTIAIIILGTGVIIAKQQGNRSLDTGVKNMVAQAIDRIHAHSTPGEPIISRSPYTYYTAALYETSEHPTYYTFSSTLNNIGSTHMLYDHPEKRGVKNLAQFANQYPKIWILAEDRHSANTPPAASWHRNQSFTLYDPVSHLPTAYGTEFVKP
jgi:mannosyltransferase